MLNDQTIIVVIGLWVVQREAGVMVKLVAIVVAPFAAALALYDLVVKRTSVTRFRFDMRPRRSSPAAPIARPGQCAA